MNYIGWIDAIVFAILLLLTLKNCNDIAVLEKSLIKDCKYHTEQEDRLLKILIDHSDIMEKMSKNK